MTKVLFENEDIKLIENENSYVVVTDKLIRCTYSDKCRIDRLVVEKKDNVINTYKSSAELQRATIDRLMNENEMLRKELNTDTNISAIFKQ